MGFVPESSSLDNAQVIVQVFDGQAPGPEGISVWPESQLAQVSECAVGAPVEEPATRPGQTLAEPAIKKAAKAARKCTPRKSAATPRPRSSTKPKTPKTVPQPDVPTEGKSLVKAPGKRSRKKAQTAE